ncbi:MAG: ribbon-helix-helix protein, CopG family [Chloroflexi bacterium]|nr:ribbon-helix-helix protein, CopG family [Chloroflexota bacterium]
MRTTVRLDDVLLRQAKEHAARSGRTLTALIEDALRRTLAEAKRRPAHPPPNLPTFRGDGLQPGVDLDDSAALLDLLEGR